VFRRIFGVPENMASQLRAVLPPGLTARLDLTRLAPVAGSFVDEALRWRHSDLLFTAPLDGRDAYVYLLAEHQSSDDPLMAFRMLRYVTRIWDQHLREHPNARLLPAVIPLVVHHGPAPWVSPVQVLDLIDLSPSAAQAVRPYLPRLEFLLDDLPRADGPQLRDRNLTPPALITLLLLKSASGNPSLPAELRPWAGQLRAILDQPGGAEVFIAILTYIELVSEASVSDLRDLAASLGPDAEEAYMTTAQMLRAEGEARGEARGERHTIRMVAQARGLALTDKHSALIDGCDDIATLQKWSNAALTAKHPDDIFK
jgi:predicted transposase/invertase (TIGR01784 family)